MKRYKIIHHTADLGFEVRAPDLSTLFLEAARALFDLSYGIKAVKAETEVDIQLQADDWENLMVKWLNELIFLMEARSYFVCRLEVMVQHTYRLSARLRGETIHPPKNCCLRHIKAATYHNLKIHCGLNEEWSAQVILDV